MAKAEHIRRVTRIALLEEIHKKIPAIKDGIVDKGTKNTTTIYLSEDYIDYYKIIVENVRKEKLYYGMKSYEADVPAMVRETETKLFKTMDFSKVLRQNIKLSDACVRFIDIDGTFGNENPIPYRVSYSTLNRTTLGKQLIKQGSMPKNSSILITGKYEEELLKLVPEKQVLKVDNLKPAVKEVVKEVQDIKKDTQEIITQSLTDIIAKQVKTDLSLFSLNSLSINASVIDSKVKLDISISTIV